MSHGASTIRLSDSVERSNSPPQEPPPFQGSNLFKNRSPELRLVVHTSCAVKLPKNIRRNNGEKHRSGCLHAVPLHAHDTSRPQKLLSARDLVAPRSASLEVCRVCQPLPLHEPWPTKKKSQPPQAQPIKLPERRIALVSYRHSARASPCRKSKIRFRHFHHNLSTRRAFYQQHH